MKEKLKITVALSICLMFLLVASCDIKTEQDTILKYRNKIDKIIISYKNNVNNAFKAGYTVAGYDAIADSMFYTHFDSIRAMRVKGFKNRKSN